MTTEYLYRLATPAGELQAGAVVEIVRIVGKGLRKVLVRDQWGRLAEVAVKNLAAH